MEYRIEKSDNCLILKISKDITVYEIEHFRKAFKDIKKRKEDTKNFVIDMGERNSDVVIVRSIIDLAHNLGLEVTAEGVESEAVWQQLIDLSCDRAQGYYLARPMPAEELSRWIRDSPWGHGLGDR